MTPEELMACREAIGWSRRQFALAIGCDEKTVRQMESGLQRIPVEITAPLRHLRKAHEGNQMPTGWQVGKGGRRKKPLDAIRIARID